jgi:hypothetical protein
VAWLQAVLGQIVQWLGRLGLVQQLQVPQVALLLEQVVLCFMVAVYLMQLRPLL